MIALFFLCEHCITDVSWGGESYMDAAALWTPGRIEDRQTDSFNWDTNPHTPRLYFKSAPPLHLPRQEAVTEPRLAKTM